MESAREADEPLGKDLVFDRDFDYIMFLRYRSIIKCLKRLGRYFDNTFLASILRSSLSKKYHFQTSGKRGNLIPRNFCAKVRVYSAVSVERVIVLSLREGLNCVLLREKEILLAGLTNLALR